MTVGELNGYRVGQHGWIEVLDASGREKRWVQGEIVGLVPVPDNTAWALIRTPAGTGLYRIG